MNTILGLRLAGSVVVAALIVPPAVTAKPDPAHVGKGKAHVKSHGKGKPASYVFKGVWHADATVTVTGGNSRVRKAGLKGTNVAFDVSAAKLRVADTNADGSVTAADLAEGDKVVVKARLPRTDPGAAPYAARQVVDQTPKAPEVEAPEAPEAG